MKHSTLEIIETLKEDGADSITSMLFALEDGAYLAKKPWTQEEVEVAHAEVKKLSQKIEKKFGTNLSMRVSDFTPGATDNFWGIDSIIELTADQAFLGCITYGSLFDPDDVDLDAVFDQIIDSLED